MDCTTKDTGDSNSDGILLDGALANPSQVQAGRFTLDDLIYRISLVLDENKFIPKIDYLTQVPYWEELHAAAESTIGWDNIIYFLGGADYFGHNEVKFPSPEQMDTIVQIATQQRIINGDDPGAMKTAPSVLEKYFIEQNILEPDEEGNCRLPTLVVVPGDIIPNWVDRIEEYTTEETDPNIVVISSRSKQKALERAMKPDVDYVIVSYTMLHQLAGVDWDSVETKDEVEKRKTELLEQGHSKRTLGDILISHIGPIRGEKKFKKHDDAGLCEQIAKEEIKKESDDVMSVLEQKFISNGPYYVILDEFHHAKNHKAIRTKRLMHICRQADWIVTMSGTKTPDNLNDIGPMAPIMDPKRFRNAKEFIDLAQRDPAVVSRFYDAHEKKPRQTVFDVDPTLKKPKKHIIDHGPNRDQMELYVSILNALQYFDNNDRQAGLTNVIMNPEINDPHNPENFKTGKKRREKFKKYFDANPKMLELTRRAESSRFAAVEQVVEGILGETDITDSHSIAAQVRAEIGSDRNNDSILMYVNQIHGVLAPLAEKLEKYGVCVIDQSKGINGKEIRLTEEEIGKLQPEGLYEDWMTCRTDLSRTGKRFLGLKNYEIMTMPEREKVRLTFQTNPDMRLLLASEPCFREGRAATKANHVVRVDRNWSPGCEAQTLGRVLRPGQIKQVHEWLLKISNTIEEGKYNYIDWKAVAINLAEKGAALDEDQRELFMKRQKPENSTVMQSEASKTTADIIASMSRDMSSEHSEEHVRTRLLQSENAAWYAFLYSEDWETAYSGHSAKAQKEIIEDLYGLKLGVTRDNLENILDLASGPAVISRVLKRETTCVELNRYQLMEGKKYHEEESEIKIKNKYLMGSMQNLNNLVELENTDQIVFDSSIAGNKRAKMESESQDLVVCSLAFHYMSCEQRQKTVREIYRTLKKDKYFVLALPKNTIDESCSMAFAQDFVNEGFEVDFSRTGTYQPSKVETASGTQKESSSFEVYILVAKKVEKDPEAQPRDDAFELEAEMMSVEPKLKMDKKKGMPNHDKEGELCSEFYNTDTGYSPKLGVVSNYIPPDAPEDKAPRTVEELFGPDAASTPADQKKGYKGTIQDPDVQEPYAPADELDSQDLLARTKKLGADGGSILARLNRILDKNGD